VILKAFIGKSVVTSLRVTLESNHRQIDEIVMHLSPSMSMEMIKAPYNFFPQHADYI
jgi:hypothetical protein